MAHINEFTPVICLSTLWNEPCLLYSHSYRASLHHDWYSFPFHMEAQLAQLLFPSFSDVPIIAIICRPVQQTGTSLYWSSHLRTQYETARICCWAPRCGLCCGATTAVHPLPTSVDRYLPPAGPTTANLLHATAVAYYASCDKNMLKQWADYVFSWLIMCFFQDRHIRHPGSA